AAGHHRPLHSFPTRRSSDLRLALPEALAQEEVERLWGAAMGHSPLWGLVVAMLLETGIKRDELLALSPLDVLFRPAAHGGGVVRDRKSTRLNSSHDQISYAV